MSLLSSYASTTKFPAFTHYEAKGMQPLSFNYEAAIMPSLVAPEIKAKRDAYADAAKKQFDTNFDLYRKKVMDIEKATDADRQVLYEQLNNIESYVNTQLQSKNKDWIQLSNDKLFNYNLNSYYNSLLKNIGIASNRYDAYISEKERIKDYGSQIYISEGNYAFGRYMKDGKVVTGFGTPEDFKQGRALTNQEFLTHRFATENLSDFAQYNKADQFDQRGKFILGSWEGERVVGDRKDFTTELNNLSEKVGTISSKSGAPGMQLVPSLSAFTNSSVDVDTQDKLGKKAMLISSQRTTKRSSNERGLNDLINSIASPDDAGAGIQLSEKSKAYIDNAYFEAAKNGETITLPKTTTDKDGNVSLVKNKKGEIVYESVKLSTDPTNKDYALHKYMFGRDLVEKHLSTKLSVDNEYVTTQNNQIIELSSGDSSSVDGPGGINGMTWNQALFSKNPTVWSNYDREGGVGLFLKNFISGVMNGKNTNGLTVSEIEKAINQQDPNGSKGWLSEWKANYKTSYIENNGKLFGTAFVKSTTPEHQTKNLGIAESMYDQQNNANSEAKKIGDISATTIQRDGKVLMGNTAVNVMTLIGSGAEIVNNNSSYSLYLDINNATAGKTDRNTGVYQEVTIRVPVKTTYAEDIYVGLDKDKDKGGKLTKYGSTNALSKAAMSFNNLLAPTSTNPPIEDGGYYYFKNVLVPLAGNAISSNRDASGANKSLGNQMSYNATNTRRNVNGAKSYVRGTR